MTRRDFIKFLILFVMVVICSILGIDLPMKQRIAWHKTRLAILEQMTSVSVKCECGADLQMYHMESGELGSRIVLVHPHRCPLDPPVRKPNRSDVM